VARADGPIRALTIRGILLALRARGGPRQARKQRGPRATVSLFNRRILTPEDFTNHPRRDARLDRDGQRKYFLAFEEELSREWEVDGERSTFRTLFRRQAYRLSRANEHDESFRLPC